MCERHNSSFKKTQPLKEPFGIICFNVIWCKALTYCTAGFECYRTGFVESQTTKRKENLLLGLTIFLEWLSPISKSVPPIYFRTIEKHKSTFRKFDGPQKPSHREKNLATRRYWVNHKKMSVWKMQLVSNQKHFFNSISHKLPSAQQSVGFQYFMNRDDQNIGKRCRLGRKWQR